MARNRKTEPAGIWVGPALKAGLICLGIVVACVGYVREKKEINVLAEQIGKREARLTELRHQNDKLRKELDTRTSAEQLDQRAKELKLGLAPAQPMQVWYRPEPGPGAAPAKPPTRLAAAAPPPDPSD
jgi:hypothetical protein